MTRSRCDLSEAKTPCGADKGSGEEIEFYVPQLGLEIEPYLAARDVCGVHHLARYHWAKDVLADLGAKRVLDVACGAGYGSFLLARGLEQATVVGADYDRRAIEHARQNFFRGNLSFTVGNLVTWEGCDHPGGVALGRFDAIVSFDTLEHLLHREVALIRLAQNLLPSGVFLFSTPCSHQRTLLNPGWEHHKIEYGHADLKNLLKRFFRVVRVPEEGNLPRQDYWRLVVNAGGVIYPNLSNPIFCSDPIQY